MIRHLALLAAVFALIGCNLEEAERMELDRSGPSAIMPAIQHLRLTDLPENPLDSFRIFSQPGEGFNIVGTWDLSAYDGSRYKLSLRAIWADGRTSKWIVLRYFSNGRTASVSDYPISDEIPLEIKVQFASSEENLLPTTSEVSSVTGAGSLQLKIERLQDDRHHEKQIVQSLPVFFVDDRPRITSLRFAGGTDSIALSRQVCVDVQFEVPATLHRHYSHGDLLVINESYDLLLYRYGQSVEFTSMPIQHQQLCVLDWQTTSPSAMTKQIKVEVNIGGVKAERWFPAKW